MKIKLDYGEKGVTVDVPDANLVKVLSMKQGQPVANPSEAIAAALENPVGCEPLSQIAKGKKDACVVICDITRPVPNALILPEILNNLESSGIPREKITILIATGIHRPNEGEELVRLVGREIAENYNIENHFARRYETHTHLGKTGRGTDVFVNSTYVDADLKITTGFIEPHLMAGFSGGRKLICPGISSLKTVKVMHSPQILEHDNAREGVIEGNPFHNESLEIAKMAGMDFMLNVALDENRNITGIFAGDLERAHADGVAHVRGHVRDTLSEEADIVITSAAGYPLDTTFYQAVKGLTAALPVVKHGGTIILAAECREGLGSPEFTQLVHDVDDPDQFMEDIYSDDYFVVDQWQFEELVKVLRKAKVYLYAEGVKQADEPKVPVIRVMSVEEGIERALRQYGEDASIAVIPRGPYILAEIENE